jgi:hypothetical protein
VNKVRLNRKLRALGAFGQGHVTSGGFIDPLVAAAANEANVGRPIWIDPPSNWEVVDQAAYVALPAIGATATVVTFTVPPGRNGVIQKIANNFVGGGWVEGTGDLIWRILVDAAPPPGATSYNNIVNSLGNPSNPTAIPGFRIYENQVVSITIFNNPAGPNLGIPVAGQLIGGRFVGYIYPRELEDGNTWL